ncbi:MAG: hypothetical protein VKJ24_00700 [Synechococcales bacterium]|nr:hypothetical protein [Synechococcales bacterium]
MKRIMKFVRHCQLSAGVLALLTLVGSPAIIPVSALSAEPQRLAQAEPNTDAAFWVPTAWFDEAKPVRVQIMNKTGETLEYLITTHTNFRRLEPGQSVTLSELSLPTFLNINPLRDTNIDYSITVNRKTNTIIAEVKLTGGQGDRTLHLDEKGAVYAY